MTKAEKLLLKAQDHPSGLSFSEFETLLSHAGWVSDHQKGSHRIYYSPKRFRITVQMRHDGKAKGYQVKQFLSQLDKES